MTSENIHIHSQEEINKMRVIGKIAGKILQELVPFIKPGITTLSIDEFVQKACERYGANPALIGYMGYEKACCTSVNHVVCHGIPSQKVLKIGDIINVDITIEKDGFHGDTSRMYTIGPVSIKAKRLIDITHEAMWHGIRCVKPGVNSGLIGYTINNFVRKHRFTSVEDYCGHGIGTTIHQAPEIRHFGAKDSGVILKEGMIFTIEPMINEGQKNVKILSDGWTVVTRDKKLSAQWEHTVLVTQNGYEILTLREEEL